VDGVFGDTYRNLGFVEEYLKTDKGIQTKFYGCSFLFKGDIKRETVDSVAALKRVLMATVEHLLKGKMFFVSTKAFVYWFVRNYEADLEIKTYTSLSDFAPVPREMISVGIRLANHVKNQEYRGKIIKFIWALGTFIQNDFAYYWRVQDPLCELDKESLNENPRKEILRLFDLAIARDNQISEKVRLLKKLASILLLIPRYKKIAKDYFNGLDIEKIKPDREDIYFMGRRQGYNFGGLSYKDRIEGVKETDKEEGNVIFGVVD
jgi:hypothetical protein